MDPIINNLGMDNKNERRHYRYKSISQNKKITDRCSSMLKCTFLQHNRTLTNYKSIRGIRIQATPKKHNQTQHNLTMQQNNLKESRKKQNNSKIIGQDIIEVAKMRLHNNSPEKTKKGVKSEMTMNRDELQYFLRKKKPVSYTMSRSAQQIKRLFSKRIQVIISQLRVKTTQQTPKSLQVTQPILSRPITAPKPKRIVMKGMKRYQTKNIITIKNVQSSTKAVKFLTQYQAGDVSGWEVQHNNEQFIRNTENEEGQQIIKRHHDTII